VPPRALPKPPPGLPRPSREDLLAAIDTTLGDVIASDLRVLFCGINPSLYSAAVGHHFARPGNRFWPALHRAGFTDRVYSPAEDRSLIDLGYGLTNVVSRATATADELAPEEFVAGGKALTRKLRRYAPRVIAFLGIGAYRSAFADPEARVGPQRAAIAGVKVWVLPNPSGLNAHYGLDDLARVYGELREEVAG
jgi:TDG/mug DNA glycosylase family protein